MHPYTVDAIVSAAKYADHDDCLAAATAEYIAAHPGLSDWHVQAEWRDVDREEIVLSVDPMALYRSGNDAGRGEAPDQDDVDEAAEALATDGGEILRAQRTTDSIAIVRTAKGDIVGIGGDAHGKGAWAVTLVAAT